MKTLPHITPRQQEILKLIYRYRFLERKQIQTFLQHKNKGLISRWLKDLKEKQYIDWFYSPDDPNKISKPATYYLNLNGIRFLRQTGDCSDEGLLKRHKEASRRQDFIQRCLLLAECGLHLEGRNKDGSGAAYMYDLEADYVDSGSEFSFLGENDFIHPHLCFTKEQDSDAASISQTYLVEFFEATTPRYMVQKKLRGYVEYVQSEEWEQAKDSEEPPIILIACATLAELIYAKRYTKKKLMDAYGDDLPEEVKIWFSTFEKIKAQGMTAIIWEDY